MMVVKKVWHILITKQRKAAVALLGFMLIGMLLETLGVSLVVPALVLMTQSDLDARYPVVIPLLDWLGNPPQEELVVLGMLSLISVYALKAVFLGFLAWKQSLFVFGLQANLSQRLFKGYLRQPYTFHLQSNSAQMVRNATTEVGMLATVTQSVLMVMSEGMVLIGISLLLLMVEPLGAITVIVVLGVAGLAFYRLTHQHIARWGKGRHYHEGLRIQHLQQGLGGVKDVKLLGREEDFRFQYNFHSNSGASAAQRQSAFQQFPRLWLEVLAISGLGGLVFLMIAQGKSIETVLPTLGLFAAAAFRLMPSVNRVLIALQSFRYAIPVIDTLHAELASFNDSVKIDVGRSKVIANELVIDNVCFSYENTGRNALEGINIQIPKGASVGFIGGSGAGKSTLVDLILGLITPTSGSIRVDGQDINVHLRGWQDQIGYVPQSIYLTDDTLLRNVAFGLSEERIDEDAVWNALRLAQLDGFVKDLPQGLNTIVGERGVRLSGGQRQRIGIARALYHDPQVLVLDEATSALDTETERNVMEAVLALHGQKTVLIVAHRLSTVKNCDRLYSLGHGRVLAEGTPNDILSVF